MFCLHSVISSGFRAFIRSVRPKCKICVSKIINGIRLVLQEKQTQFTANMISNTKCFPTEIFPRKFESLNQNFHVDRIWFYGSVPPPGFHSPYVLPYLPASFALVCPNINRTLSVLQPSFLANIIIFTFVVQFLR